jgi:hypothetical protein
MAAHGGSHQPATITRKKEHRSMLLYWDGTATNCVESDVGGRKRPAVSDI